MDLNFEGEKTRNNCFGVDKINLEKPRSRRSTTIANSKIRALGLLIVTYFAIENGGLKNGTLTLERDILERKILKRDILGRDTPRERDILKRNSDGLIAFSPKDAILYQSSSGKYQATNILRFQRFRLCGDQISISKKQRINAFGLAFIEKEKISSNIDYLQLFSEKIDSSPINLAAIFIEINSEIEIDYYQADAHVLSQPDLIKLRIGKVSIEINPAIKIDYFLANGTTKNISPELKIDSNESTVRQNSLKRITHSIIRRLDFSSLFFGHRLESDHIGTKLTTDSNELTEQQNAQKSKELNQLELQEPAEPSSIQMGFAKEKRCQMKLQRKRN